MVTTDALEEKVMVEINAIIKMPGSGRFRCHEIARLLKPQLISAGIPNVSLHDGIVSYKKKFLDPQGLGDCESWLRDALAEEYAHNSNPGHTRPVPHSWLEIGEVIVDYQNTIRINRDDELSNVLVVRTKKELACNAEYHRIGREFAFARRRFLYLPLWYMTLLRV